MIRALYSNFSGPLYTVIRASDNTTAAIPPFKAGGYSNAAVQEKFCAGTDCVVTTIWDQSPMSNHLLIFNYSTATKKRLNKGVNASVDPHMVGGHRVYSAYFGVPGTKDGSGEGYRTPPGPAKGVAVGHESESMYMVTSGRNYSECSTAFLSLPFAAFPQSDCLFPLPLVR